MVDIFKTYGRQYDFDWLLLAAQGYQESGLDQNKRSHVGAIGVMQVLPTTASDARVNINDIDKLENNVHAGVKYLRFVMDEYFKDEKIPRREKFLFAIASYNAGPAKIARLRKQAATEGLNPNVWFNNVEVIAGKVIGQETVQYVSNIYKYYVAYKAVNAQKAKKKGASTQN